MKKKMNLFQALISKFKKKEEIKLEESIKRKPGRPKKSLIDKDISVPYNSISTVKYSPLKSEEKSKKEEPPKRLSNAIKFNDLQKDHICRMIASYESGKAIEKWAEEQGTEVRGKDIRYDYSHNQTWRPVIEKYRKEFLAEVSEIPIASKVKRLHELNNAFDRVREREDSSEKLDERLACIEKEAMLLSKAQGELEGKVPVEQTNYYITQFNNMTREERDKYKLSLVEKLKGRLPLDQSIEIKPIIKQEEHEHA